MKVVTLEESKPLPSYLVAFVVGPFELVDGGARRPRQHADPLHRAARPRRRDALRARGDAAHRRRAREVLRHALSVRQARRRRGAALLGHHGAPRHRRARPAADAHQADRGGAASARSRYANIAIHELAHFWFGDYVTCRWWNDVWLNEALGSWADVQITDALEPSWKFDARPRSGRRARCSPTDRPTVQKIRLPVETKDAIQNSFDNNITYAKGSAVLHMIEHWVGHDKFMAAIRDYLGVHAWGNADADEFIASLRQNLGAPAAEVMQSFVDQPGVPIVTAAVRCEGGAGKVTLSQKRFFNAADQDSPSLWKVPVCLKWQGGTQLHAARRAAEGGDAAELSDVARGQRRRGRLLPRALRRGVAGGAEAGVRQRADGQGAHASGRRRRRRRWSRGRCRSATRSRSCRRSSPTTICASTRAGVDLFTLLNVSALDDNGAAAYGRAVAKLFGARARTVGWAPKPGEDPEMARLRPELLGMVARRTHDKAVIAEAHKLAERWLRRSPGGGAGHGRSGAAHGGATRTTPSSSTRCSPRRGASRIGASARSCSARSAASSRRRCRSARWRWSTGSEFDLRESLNALYPSLFDRETREATWAWLQAHFDGIVGKMREDDAMHLFGTIPHAFCDETHRAAAETFLAPRAKTHPGAGARARRSARGRQDLRGVVRAQQDGDRRLPGEVLARVSGAASSAGRGGAAGGTSTCARGRRGVTLRRRCRRTRRAGA